MKSLQSNQNTTVTRARRFYGTEMPICIPELLLERKIYIWRQSQLRENEFRKQLTSWEPRAVGRRKKKKKDYRQHEVIVWHLTGFPARVNERRIHSWCCVIALSWKPCSGPGSHDEYPLNRFLMASKVKTFPKFQMTTNSLRFLENPALGDVVGWHSSHWD